jgi:hypothetical protein
MQKNGEKLMAENAYWISPSGGLISVDRHIHLIIQKPQLFGLTKPDIEKMYKKYKEPIGLEGHAREQLMLHVMNRGWIRLRNRGGNWTVQLGKLDGRTKRNLFDGIYAMIKRHDVSKYGQFTIHDLSTNKVVSSSAPDVLSGKVFEQKKIKEHKSQLGSLAKWILYEHLIKEVTVPSSRYFVIDDKGKILPIGVGKFDFHGSVVDVYPKLEKDALETFGDESTVRHAAAAGHSDLYAILYRAGFVRGGMNFNDTMWIAIMSSKVSSKALMSVLAIIKKRGVKKMDVEDFGPDGYTLRNYHNNLSPEEFIENFL